MKKQIYIIIVLCLTGLFDLRAQTSNQLHSWWYYSGNHYVSDQFSIFTMYSFRRSDFARDWQQSLLRVGGNYHCSYNIILTAGYDWVINFPYGEQPIAKRTIEHRIYQQVVLKSNIANVGITNLYRLEQRIINDQTLHRLRYRSGFNIPFSSSNATLKAWSIELYNEVFINMGPKAVGHYFDQNWLYGGLAWKLRNSVVLKLGYMNQYIAKADNVHRESNHTLQVGLDYGLDLRKQKKG